MKTCLAVASILTTIVFVSCAKKSDDANRPLPSDREVLLSQSTDGCKLFVNRLTDDFKNQPGAFYDFISVHENSDDSSSPLIHIFYYGRMVEGQTPVVFFNGGPTSDSHSSYFTLTQKQRQDDTWAQIPFIFIDQRGTGCSDPYPQGSADPILQRLVHYGSRGIVGDAEQIRAHLGVTKWKVFGQSYGAFIVHRYMTLAPQSITSAFAHAGIITSDPMDRLTGRIRSQNRVIEQYLADFPTDRAVLQVLDQQLTPSLCFPYLKTQKRCGFEIVAPLLGSLGFYSQWLYLHQEFNLMVKKGALDTARITAYIKRNESLLPPPGHAVGTASRVIGWSDRNVAVENKANCQQVYEKLKALGDKPETFLFNECSAPLQELETYPDSLLNRIEQTIRQDLLTLVDFKRSLTANPAVGFFLYSGARDAYVPEDDFQEELQTVGSLVHYTHFLDTGHDGFYTEPQVWDDLSGN